MTDTIDKLILQFESIGADKVNAQFDQMVNGMHGIVVASEQTERSTTSLENKFASLERRFGTTAGQAAQLAKVQKTVSDAVAQDASLRERGNDILTAATSKFADAAKAGDTLAKSTGLARWEMINLSRQLQDIGVSLVSGQSPFVVMTQQGSQIADIFASTNGTVSGALQQIGAKALGLLTPMRLVVGGVAGIAAAAVYLGQSWEEAAAQVDRALTGVGARTGTTAADIANFTKANSSALTLSVSEARNVALEFTKTGEVTIAGLRGVGDAVHGYALLTGKDATEATKTFTEAISGDLFKGIEALDKRYGALNASSLEYIRTLIDQGDKTKALQTYIDLIEPANKRAEESVGSLTRAWQGFKNVVSNIAAGPAPSSLEDQIKDLQRQRERASSTAGVGVTPQGLLNTAAAFGGKTAELDEFDRKISELQQKLRDFKADAAVSQLNNLSKAAFDATNAVLPQIEAINKLNAAIELIQSNRDMGIEPANAGAATAVYQHQRDLLQDSLDTTVRQAQAVQNLQAAWGGVSAQTAVTLQHLEGQLQVAQQVTAAGQMKAQQEAQFNDLLAQGVSAEEAGKIAAEQRAISEATATSNVERQTQSIKDQTALIQARRNGNEAEVTAAIAYKNAINSGADATAAAALSAATLENAMAKAAGAAGQLSTSLSSTSFAGLGGGVGLGGGIGISNPNSGFTYSPANMNTGPGSGGFLGDQPLEMQRGTFAQSGLSGDPLLFALDASGSPAVGSGVPSQIDIKQMMKATGDSLDAFRDAQAQFLIGSNAKADKIAGYSLQILGLMQGLGEHPENYWKIQELQRSIRDLKDSTDDLNSTMKVSLNPLYNGRDALKVGYYKAATGLEGIVSGTGGVDSTPVHMMLTPGERIQVTPPGQNANDNSKTIIQNNTFNFSGSQSTARRGKRQFAQGFGQVMASVS